MNLWVEYDEKQKRAYAWFGDRKTRWGVASPGNGWTTVLQLGTIWEAQKRYLAEEEKE